MLNKRNLFLDILMNSDNKKTLTLFTSLSVLQTVFFFKDNQKVLYLENYLYMDTWLLNNRIDAM